MPLTTNLHHVANAHEDERVIIIAPVGQDAEAMAAVLKSEGFETQICQRLDECSRQIADSAGAVLLTEEALESAQGSRFLDVLRSTTALVRIAAHHSHQRRRIAPGRIIGFGGSGRRNRDFAGAAHQHPDADAFGAGGITFSPAAIPGARSRQPAGELKPNARAASRPAHRRSGRTRTKTPSPLGRIVACRGAGASAHRADAT